MMTIISRKAPIVAPQICVLLLLDPSDVGMSGVLGGFAIKSASSQEITCSSAILAI